MSLFCVDSSSRFAFVVDFGLVAVCSVGVFHRESVIWWFLEGGCKCSNL